MTNPQEFSQAIRAATAGEVIVLANGLWKDAELAINAQGAEERPITVRAETPGKVVLSGNSRLRIGGKHIVVEGLWLREIDRKSDDLIAFRTSSSQHAEHCRLTNCAITQCTPPDKADDTKWVSLYGSHNRVDHCYFAGKLNAGTTLVVWLAGQPNHHQIDHNHFGPRPRLGKNGGESIRVGTSEWSLHESRTLVEQNLFQECNGEIEIVSNKSCDNVYRHNTFVECEGALTLRHGNRCTVEGNFFLGNGKENTGGVRIIGEDHRVYNNYFDGLKGKEGRSAISLMNGVPDSPLNLYSQALRAQIVFNTFVDCRIPLTIGIVGDSKASLAPKDGVFANNVLFGGEATIQQVTEPIDWTWKANVVNARTKLKAPEGGFERLDPKLSEMRGVWRVTGESPTFGAAEGNFDFVTDDIDGQPRGARKNIGCDQASDAPIVNNPLAAKDVGPAWLVER